MSVWYGMVWYGTMIYLILSYCVELAHGRKEGRKGREGKGREVGQLASSDGWMDVRSE